MKRMIKKSEAEQGELVTTFCKLGGVGVGRLIDGEVYKSDGNGFFSLVKNDAFGLDRFERDGGAGYRNRVRELFSWA